MDRLWRARHKPALMSDLRAALPGVQVREPKMLADAPALLKPNPMHLLLFVRASDFIQFSNNHWRAERYVWWLSVVRREIKRQQFCSGRIV